MSVRSWCKEFYPVTPHLVEEEDAIDHSLQKFIGLRPENLLKHDVRKNGNTIVYDNYKKKYNMPREDYVDSNRNNVIINASSCALCHHHMDKDILVDYCSACPIYGYNKSKGFDEPHESCHEEYMYWHEGLGPEKMIQLLENTIKWIEQQKPEVPAESCDDA